jgi:glycosyltransferase involved in cell wall biosynthesis
MKNVTVIIPNYNHAVYLEQRIESVLKQNYRDFELILLDDCSTDSSIEVIEKYREHEKTAHVFLNQKNSGTPFGLWKTAVEAASGKYIWIAESDDWASEDFLLNLVPVLENSDAVMAHSNSFFYINGQYKLNEWWDSFQSKRWNSDYIEDGSKLLKEYGRYKCPVINVSSALIKKEVLKNDFYPVNFRYSGDWWFWANIFRIGKVAFISKPLNVIRVHNQSVTQNNKGVNIKKLKEDVRIINEINKQLNIKLKYDPNYDWLIDLWLSIFKNNGKYFSLENHIVELHYTFKIAFYKRYFLFIFNKITVKLTK